MKQYQRELVDALAMSGGILIDFTYLDTAKVTLPLKDGRRALYFVNIGNLNSGMHDTILNTAYATYIVTNTDTNSFDLFTGHPDKGPLIVKGTNGELWKRYSINKHWVFHRKGEKNWGEKGVIIGKKPIDGSVFLGVDDVITSSRTKKDEEDWWNGYAEENSINIEFSDWVIGVDRQQKAVVGGNCTITGGGEEIEKSAAQYYSEETGRPVHIIIPVLEMFTYLYDEKKPGTDISTGIILDPFITDEFMKALDKYQKEHGIPQL